MEFKNLVLERRSIRCYAPEQIPDAEIRDILSTAVYACNSGNQQLWRFLVIQSEAVKEKMGNIIRERAAYLVDAATKANPHVNQTYESPLFYLQAPAIIAVVTTGKYQTKPDLLMRDMGHAQGVIDDLRCRGDLQTVGAVTQLILLAAWEKGLGGCWLTGPLFARYELEQLLGLAEGETLAAMISLGKPTTVPARNGRKPLDEVLRFIK